MTKLQIRMRQVDQVKDFVDLLSKYPYEMDLVSGRYTIDAKQGFGIILEPFYFSNFAFFSFILIYLISYFYLFIIICRKRGFHMPAERKKHLAKEISTPDARGLKVCRKRLLQPNQPK